MGSGNLYLRPANTKKNEKGSRSSRSFLFAGLFCLSMPFASQAAPTFLHGVTQTLTVCQNSSNNNFGDELTITDTANGVIETWSIVSGPAPGNSVSGFPFSSVADGGVLTTAGGVLTYTPAAGFSGLDPITFQVVAGTDTAYTTINIVVSSLPSVILAPVPAICAGSTSTLLTYSNPTSVGPTSAVFGTPGSSEWTVPPGVNSVHFDVEGGVGGGDSYSGAPNPGNGGKVEGNLAVTPGEQLYIYVGGAGQNGSPSGAQGGFNGGGNASNYFFGAGGAGGGASDIRANDSLLSHRVAVAGGGGGNGWDAPGASAGGAGGNLIGGSGGANVSGSHAGGGITIGGSGSGGAHATYVGWTPGGNGTILTGGNGSTQGVSGGGGGGFFGGGGGVWSGGGGGSSYADATSVSGAVFTQGFNIGDGKVALDYSIPGTYDIIWTDPAIPGVTFINVSGGILPAGTITLSVPFNAPPATYNAVLRIHNGTCTSSDIPFTVTINPIPDVDTTGIIHGQVLCNGTPTSSIFFNGSVPSTTFNWTNSQPGVIGLPGTGSGDIPSFTATDTSSLPVVALITVTPVANGCTGPSVIFPLNINPTPSFTSTLSPDAVCDSVQFNYTPTSGTPGTTFTWFRDAVAGISNVAQSAAGNPGEYLNNISPNTITVPYNYTLYANGCANYQTVTATVYPKPVLSGATTAAAICNNTLFSYAPLSATPSTTFMWNRNTITGISNSAATGANNPLETLHNTTADPIVVPYTYTLAITGTTCTNTETVSTTVYPSATLNSVTSPSAICDSALFNYVASSATTGTTFTWSRAFVLGIGNTAGSGLDTINENLVNITDHPIVVTYNYSLTANGCANAQSVMVTVNPKPMLSSAITPSVCDSSVFNYTPTSGTTGTTFTWTRDTVTGISNHTGAGINNPMETLLNTTAHPVIATYIYTMMANGCSNTEKISLTVNPRPMLSSSLTPPAICDSSLFNYPPSSNTAGATFSWFRPYMAGIYAVAQTGTGNPNQQLINSTYVPVTVTYQFTITANGCSNTQDVHLSINPTPKLNPPFVGTVCSGSPFSYVPTSYTPGATYAWNRPEVAHITPGNSFAGVGNGVINETLVDDVLAPQQVTYIYRLSINGCTNLGTQNLRLTVNPAPKVPSIVISPNADPCSNTLFQNFGAEGAADNVSYVWSVQNASIYAEGTNNQNILVNFDRPGKAVISVNSNVNGFNGCVISNSITYDVSESESPAAQVVYYNGQLICLRNDNSSYQWGYDDAATLDSTMIDGQIDQVYSISNLESDKLYWCITTKDGCSQKSYFNNPTAVADVNANVAINVYPNPAKEKLNVEISTTVTGNMSIEVLNMLGQKLDVANVNNHKATIDVANLPAGAYLLDCYRDGSKVATTRFIKN